MLVQNFLKNRKSVREFKDKEISYDNLDKIKNLIESLNSDIISGNINLRLYENGDNLYKQFKDQGGYAGVMIKSPHYIIIERSNNDRENIINSSYYTEKLITKLANMDIDTCWISVENVSDEVKKESLGEQVKIVDHLVAIGYGVEGKTFDGKRPSNRKGIDEIVFDGSLNKGIRLSDLEKRGLKDLFYYASFAPSDKNRQPWRFILDDSKVKLLAHYDEWKDSIYIDLGIIMYYFEYLASLQGINNKWELVDKNAFVKDGKKYIEVGEIKL